MQVIRECLEFYFNSAYFINKLKYYKLTLGENTASYNLLIEQAFIDLFYIYKVAIVFVEGIQWAPKVKPVFLKSMKLYSQIT